MSCAGRGNDRGRVGAQNVHGLLVILRVLCGVVGGTRGKKREKSLLHDGVDGGGGTGVNSHWVATTTYRMIGPGMTDLMVLFDNQQFGNRTDRTQTSKGVQNVGLRTRGGGSMLIINN